jgi:alpha-beta hydrolase superfamily lysophospholipase
VSNTYSWRSGNELWLRHGANHPLQVIIIEPLFEEANRCRHLLVSVMHGLAANGIGSALPDLPGTGESLADIHNVAFSDWHEALSAFAEMVKPVVIASLRGGALLDGGLPAKGYWRFAPETGARIVRDLRRTQLSGSALYAGHAISDAFLAALEVAPTAPVAPLRTLRLESDAGDADAKILGSPLWRRAEPGDDPGLAAALVADLTDWVTQCAAR